MTSSVRTMNMENQQTGENCPDCDTGFTEQCTDECRVVACDEHACDETVRLELLREAALLPDAREEKKCLFGGPLTCPNFDRIIRTEYFPQLRSGRPNSPTSRHLTLPYDPDTPMLIPPMAFIDRRESSPPSSDGTFHGSPELSSGSSIPVSPMTIADLGFPIQRIQSSATRCLWSGCNSFFNSAAELISHVNMNHLSPPTAEPSHSKPQPEELPSLWDGSLQCLWKDCNSSASTMAVAGPSTHSVNVPPETVMAHLLQEHLGLTLDAATVGVNGHPDRKYLVDFEDTTQYDPCTLPETDNRIYLCHWDGCGSVCGNSEMLNNHITEKHVGSGKAHYDCFWAGCDRNGERGFASKQKVCRHVQSHTGHKPFPCDICKQSFSEAATLQQHMRRHTRERPCVCDFPGCNKSFATTGALTIHKRIHIGSKPFKCTYCDKSFSESSNLAKHLRTHTGEKPYPCPEHNCGKAFARPDQLTRHLAVHAKKRQPVGI